MLDEIEEILEQRKAVYERYEEALVDLVEFPEPNISKYAEFDIINYKDATEQADVVIFLVAHKEFNNLGVETNLDFCGVLK